MSMRTREDWEDWEDWEVGGEDPTRKKRHSLDQY